MRQNFDLKNKKGLWLLEILIAVTIMALVAATVAYVFNQSLITFRVASDENKASQNTQTAMDWLVRDISDATCIYQANPNSLILRNPTYGYVTTM